MNDIIPFFYYDLLARVASGGLVLGFLKLTNLRPPAAIRDWKGLVAPAGDTAQAVLLPFLVLAAAYLIGLVFDVFLAGPLRTLSRTAFRSAAAAYPWFEQCADAELERASQLLQREKVLADDLGKWAFDAYLVRTARDLPSELPHTVRFHAEAKFFFHSAVAAALFVVAADIDALLQLGWTRLDDSRWLGAAGLFAAMLYVAAKKRLRRRSEQVLSFIDHFCQCSTDCCDMKELRCRLQAYVRRDRAAGPGQAAAATGADPSAVGTQGGDAPAPAA